MMKRGVLAPTNMSNFPVEQLMVNEECILVAADHLHPFCPIGSYDYYPWFHSGQGRYTYIRNVQSPQLKNVRDLVVYLPPSYDENPFKRYDDVLVMHDGQNLFNVSTAFMGNSWKCQDALDGEIVGGRMREVVVIGVDNTNSRIYELTYSKVICHVCGFERNRN